MAGTEVLNGIMIGFQTDPSFQDYDDVFFYLELATCLVLQLHFAL